MEKYAEQFLEQEGIEYALFEHPAVFTCEEADIHCKDIPGTACKNLFLRDKNADSFFLVIMPASEWLAMSHLEKILGVKKLTFAKEEELLEILKLSPGAVSPLGLINDANKITQVIIDSTVWNAGELRFHPNDNAESIVLCNAAFRKMVASFGVHLKLVELG